MTGNTGESYSRGARVEKSNCQLNLWDRSLATKAQPDQIDGPADSYQQADQSQIALTQPLVQTVANPSPEEQAR